MASPSHQAIYNLSRGQQTPQTTFHQFLRLPIEIRIHIWRASLEQYRIIRVQLAPNRLGSASSASVNDGSNAVSSNKYQAKIAGHQIFSKLLRVNSEAREVALGFYHVHIPCQLKGRDKVLQEATIYLSSNYDFLHISPKSPTKDTLVPFLRDLKIHDLRGVGLLNLAIEHNDLKANDMLDLSPADLEGPDKNVFVETLSQLRQVFFVSTPHVGRANAGAMMGIRGAGVQFNSAFPTFTNVPRFERLHRDPRPISDDLRKVVFANADPREVIFAWGRLLENWDIKHTTPVDYRFLLAVSPVSDEDSIYDYNSAEARLEKESQRWQKSLEKLSKFHKNRSFTVEPSHTIGAAFGFWLFPVSAGLEAPLGLSEEVEHKWNQVLDMTDCWPELALSDLH